MIVQQLQAIQQRHGYLPRAELTALADRFDYPLYRLEEVASFFPHFRKQPPHAVEIRICRDMACRLRGSQGLVEQTQQSLNGREGWSVCEVSCLGRCDRAPVAMVEMTTSHDAAQHHEHLVAPASEGRFASVLAAIAEHRPFTADTDAAFRPDDHRQWQIDPYQSEPARYATIRKFLTLTDEAQRNTYRDEVIKALETANLLGMGGAGGRAYKKWSEVRQAVGERKYVVCNADESEPGTFKDRELLLRTPHLIVEGVILGGLVVGAQRGYIYVRHEYHEQIEALEREIARAVAAGVCGTEMSGTDCSFQLEVFISPGGYICGEQTALIEAMEDKRAEPRNRPPELQTNGLWNCPTLLNNVETLAWVSAIMERERGKWYAAAGALPEFKGRRFFSVSGDVARPGAYEVPIGITLGELIDDYCGGIARNRKLKAVALSGPSGGFLPAHVESDHLATSLRDQLGGKSYYDLREARLDIAYFRKLKWMLGAGIVIYADDADLVEQALACTTFYRYESCGKCVPCRIGSQKLLELVERLSAGELTMEEVERVAGPSGEIAELAHTMTITAICGLGTVAANPLISLLKYFPDDVKRYLRSH